MTTESALLRISAIAVVWGAFTVWIRFIKPPSTKRLSAYGKTLRTPYRNGRPSKSLCPTHAAKMKPGEMALLNSDDCFYCKNK